MKVINPVKGLNSYRYAEKESLLKAVPQRRRWTVFVWQDYNHHSQTNWETTAGFVVEVLILGIVLTAEETL